MDFIRKYRQLIEFAQGIDKPQTTFMVPLGTDRMTNLFLTSDENQRLLALKLVNRKFTLHAPGFSSFILSHKVAEGEGIMVAHSVKLGSMTSKFVPYPKDPNFTIEWAITPDSEILAGASLNNIAASNEKLTSNITIFLSNILPQQSA